MKPRAHLARGFFPKVTDQVAIGKELRKKWKKTLWREVAYPEKKHGAGSGPGRELLAIEKDVATSTAKTDSIFRRTLIVDEELLAQATGAVVELLSDPNPRGPDDPRLRESREHGLGRVHAVTYPAAP